MDLVAEVIPKATRPTRETTRTVAAVGLCREIVVLGMEEVVVPGEEEEEEEGDGRSGVLVLAESD